MLHKIFNKYCTLATSMFIYSGNGIIFEPNISRLDRDSKICSWTAHHNDQSTSRVD